MPGSQQFGRRTAQLLLLVVEDLQGKSGIQFGVVDPPTFELSVLVVLDQVVIGVARECQWIKPERVHRRQPQQSEAGTDSLQIGQVEIDQIVAE